MIGRSRNVSCPTGEGRNTSLTTSMAGSPGPPARNTSGVLAFALGASYTTTDSTTGASFLAVGSSRFCGTVTVPQRIQEVSTPAAIAVAGHLRGTKTGSLTIGGL